MSEMTPERLTQFSKDAHPESKEDQRYSGPSPASRAVASRFNWPLWVGAGLIASVFLIALFGPTLAPQDPMRENTIIQVDHGWELPPFPPLAVPGFVLGSDQFGRDLFSRMLWGLRPTLAMIVIVASVRLMLGIGIGLSAGWSEGQISRAIDSIIDAALSVPTLIVALAAIALVGVEYGLLAFVVGLSVTGWAATARIVRDQTHLVKESLYIEAIRALGASDVRIVARHVLRQIMPLVWMLFSFEIGSTLITTAGLGFLGFYIGGDVWVDVDDFVARRLSGTPELGQMLASAWNEQQVITEPWGMIIAGSVVFITVLGFNLLGEGLRLRLDITRVHRRTAFQAIRERAGEWARNNVSGQGSPFSVRPERLGQVGLKRVLVIVTAVAVIGSAYAWWAFVAGDSSSLSDVTHNPVTSEHLWSGSRGDSQGTLWSNGSGPERPVVNWTFLDAAGLSGGPAVSDDGNLFIASKDGTVYALTSSGTVLWRNATGASAVGSPALGNGVLYVTDDAGGLTAFSLDGEQFWRYRPEQDGRATTGPVVGSNGTIFYPAGGKVFAISPQGELVWAARAPYGFNPRPPALSTSDELLFYLDSAFNTSDGSSHELTALEGKAGNSQVFVGADGNTYYRSQGRVLQWAPIASGTEIVQSLTKQVPGHPRDSGVTPDGIVWATYTVGYNSPEMGIVWVNWDDQVLGNIEYIQAPSRVIGVGTGAVLYSCGNASDGSVECVAAEPGAQELLWRTTLAPDGKVAGGALVPDRLYVTLENGAVFALGKAEARLTETQLAAVEQTKSASVKDLIQGAEPGDRAETTEFVDPTTYLAQADAPADAVMAGALITFALPVFNRGPEIAPGVVLTDSLPNGMTLVSIASSHGQVCVEMRNIIVCKLGDLLPGTSAMITEVVQVDPNIKGTLGRSAAVTSGANDPNPNDNRVEHTTIVRGPADLQIGQTVQPDPAIAGQPLTYTLSITNGGPGAASGVLLTSTLPMSTSLVAATVAPAAVCERIREYVQCAIGILEVSATVRIAVSLAVPADLTGTISHNVSVIANEPDLFPANNRSETNTTILTKADTTIGD